MKIYADVLFFINFIGAYILIDLTARITHHAPKQRRRCAAAAIGAAIAVVSFCTGEYSGLFKLAAAVIVPVAAFSLRGSDTLRQIIVYSLASVAMSAVFALINSLNNSQTVIMRGGTMYFDIPVMRFMLIFAAAYLVMSVSVWFIKRGRNRNCVRVVIELRDKKAELTALFDSGNVLKEPITGKDVVVAEWDKIKTLFDNIEYKELKKEADKYKLWLVPYHSLGNTGGLMYAFLADDINIVCQKRSIGKTFVGITTQKLSAKNEYNALIGAI